MKINKKINIISPKKISMDTLGKMIKGGFDAVDRRFNGVDKRFDEQKSYMDIGFQKLDEKIDAVESNLEARINKRGALVHY